MVDSWEDKYVLKQQPPEPPVPSGRGRTTEPTVEDRWAGVKLSPVAQPTHYGAVLPFTTYSDKSVRFEPSESGLLSPLIQSLKAGGRSVERATKGEPPVMGDVLSAALLGVTVNPFVRSGDRAFPGVAGVAAEPRLAPARGSLPFTQGGVPSSEQLLGSGGQRFDAVRAMPVRYDPSALRTLADQAEQQLMNMGVLRRDSKKLYAALDDMRNVPRQPGYNTILDPANLISIRRNIANYFENPKENKAAVGEVFSRVNNFIERPPQGAVLAGPAAKAGRQYGLGNADYAAGMRGKDLAQIAYEQRLRAASANSGQNADNALRQGVRQSVIDEAAMRGYTPAEAQALEQIVLGAEGANIRRNAGNFLGGGGGLGAAVTSGLAGAGANFVGAGPAVTGLAVASVPLLGGYLKRRAAERTAQALEDVSAATRRRSPLFLEQPGPDVAPNISFGREAMTRAIIGSEPDVLQGAGEATGLREPQPSPDQQQQQSQPLRITVTPWDRYDPENRL